MNIFSFIIKDLFRQKAKLFFALSGVAIGIAVCIIMLALSEGIRVSFKSIFERRNTDLIVFEKDQFSIINSEVAYGLIDSIKEMPEVIDAAGSIFNFHRVKRNIVPLYGWQTDSFLFDNIEIIKGRNIIPGELEVIIGQSLEKNTDSEIGKTIPIKGKRFKIVGIFNSSSLFERSAIIAPLSTIQNIYRNKHGKISTINVRLKEDMRTKKGTEKAITIIESAFPEVTAQNVDIFIAEKTKYIIMGKELANVITIIIIIAVILGLANTMITSVYNKKKLMGVLLAIGWQKKDVFMMLFIESIIIALAGGLIGLGFGYYAINHIIATTNLRIFMPTWNYIFALKMIGIIISTGIVATFIPAFITINLNPVEVIHNE